MFNLSKLVVAWDLDGTIVDSSNRIRFDQNGVFDLDYWRETSNDFEMVSQDKLLPLIEVYRSFKKAGYTQICVTARLMCENDFKYLEENNISFDMILHRGDSLELDYILKSKRLKDYFELSGRIPFMAFDDKEDNLRIFDKFGFRTFQANYMNEKMKKNSLSEVVFNPSDFN